MKGILLRFSYVVVVLGLVVCCVAAVRPDLFGIGGEKDAVQTAAAPENVDVLAEFVLEREQLRAMQLAQLDEIVNGGSASEELMDSAQRERLEIVRRAEVEQTISGVLRSMGYIDAAAAASETGVTVMLRADNVTEGDVSIITDLVFEHAKVGPENLRIIPINTIN